MAEAAFAQDFGLRVGDRVSVEGRSFEVAGLAVTAVMAPYPASSCWAMVPCASGLVSADTTLPGPASSGNSFRAAATTTGGRRH